MTRTASRARLDELQAAIERNCADLFAGAIDEGTFRARQREAHDEIDRAGQRETFLRRWRARASAAARA